MATVAEDVIAAVGTAPGEAGIAVIRVSGPGCVQVVEQIFRGRQSLKDAPSHRMVYGAVVDPDTAEVLDEVLVVRMQAPRSYTGEDVVEIHTHGGSAVVGRVLNAVVRAGARPAEPGEFTKRAFLNGRLDLSQAEAVIDLIRSKTDAARRLALEQLKGGLSARVKQMREILLDVMAQIEVTIDYPEHDVEDVTIEQIREAVYQVREQIDELLASSRVGRLVREGVRTAIVGRPNVGKSSLLNALAGRERAIVTAIPGTTRDVVDEWIHVRGVAFQILDTAGIRTTEDEVERIGVERSLKWVEEADLVLCVLDGSSPLEKEDLELLERIKDRPFLLVVNKIDLPQRLTGDGRLEELPQHRIVRVSARTGDGVQELADRMARVVLGGEGVSASSCMVTNMRHMALLKEAREDLDAAERAVSEGWTVDVAAVDLRAAWEHLGDILGERAGEELLNRIFSQFCLGK
ncbi:MAG TPA: tRNA uridine-5-carboxymethylaminomethyl(34) synthesis GTPase MnmE [Alicyclobacillus sp.]|nr:tRNA uridine-5-carboxymethylaminomethyl(34) synthesis GTPase MnmE [Alicyclobacillus sp.]